GEERARITGLDPGAPLEGHAFRERAEPSAQSYLRHSGRAQIERLDVPILAVDLQIAADTLQRGTCKRELLDGDTEANRQRKLVSASEMVGKGLDGEQRTPP